MLNRISNWMYKVTTGWLTLLALLIFLVFTALVLPAQSFQTDAYAGTAGSPDTSLFYSPQDLYHMAEAYGMVGRSAYIQARFTFDLLWPLVYGFFLCAVISWIYSRGFPSGGVWRLANLVPLLGMLFDYIENLTTSLVMYRYPTQTPVLDWLAPLFTLAKWIFVIGSFALLLIGALMAIWRWVVKKGSR